MKYSNVHESFLDFLKDRKNKEYKKTLERIQIFLKNNQQYGYEISTGLPGLCPLEKLSQTIVASEKQLKKVIREMNIENLKITRISSKVWSGDVLVVLPSEKIGKEYGKYTQNYNLSAFSSHLQDYGYGSYRTKRKRKTGVSFNESIFSDFIDYLSGDSDSDADAVESNMDNAYVQVTRFLVKYPYFDFDKTSDTPGLIFLSSLSRNIQIPVKTLSKLFKSKKFENADVVEISVSGIEGPVVVFGNPPFNRIQLLNSWETELKSMSPEEINQAIDSSKEIEKELSTELPKEEMPVDSDVSTDVVETPTTETPTTKTSKSDEIIINVDIPYEITDEENQKRKEEIVKETTEAIIRLMKDKPKNAQSVKPELTRVYGPLSRSSYDESRSIISNFITKLLDEAIIDSSDVIERNELVNKVIKKSEKRDDFYYFMESEDGYSLGLELSTIINNSNKILDSFFNFYMENRNKSEVEDASKGIASSKEAIPSKEITEPEQKSVQPKSDLIVNVEDEQKRGPKGDAGRQYNSSNFLKELFEQSTIIEQIITNPNEIQKELMEVLKNSNKKQIIEGNSLLIMDLIESPDDVFKNQLLNKVFIPYKDKPNEYFFMSKTSEAVTFYLKVIFDNYAKMLLDILKENR